MTTFADELLTVTSATALGPTRATIDNLGGSRAFKMTVSNLGPGIVGLRIGENPPDIAGYNYRPIASGASIQITGYDDIAASKFIAVSSTCKLFVEYAS